MDKSIKKVIKKMIIMINQNLKKIKDFQKVILISSNRLKFLKFLKNDLSHYLSNYKSNKQYIIKYLNILNVFAFFNINFLYEKDQNS